MAPVMNFDILNRTNGSTAGNNYYSPRQFRQHQPYASTYSKPLNNINNLIAHHNSANNYQPRQSNKENSSPSLPTKPVLIGQESSSEIMDAAQRILAKRNNNNNNETENNTNNTSLVKSIRNKFEDPNTKSTSNLTIHLTPRSIIKKFEQMTRDNNFPNQQLINKK